MKKKRIILCTVIPLALVLFFFVIPMIVSVIINNALFKKRSDINPDLKLSTSDFSNLLCEDVTFNSNKNEELHGYLYSSDTLTPKGVVVYAHGYNAGGSNSTMMFANYFVSNDYYYFTYDITANGLSEGNNQRGLVQGVLDLDKAISCVKAMDKTKDYPIMLLGHSWGGYSVGSVLKMHPDVKAVCSLSGFNSALDLMASTASKKVGSFLTNASLPYLKIYENWVFGKNYKLNAIDGFKSSECKVLIMHSSDDKIIDMNYGYNKYYKEFKDNPRFTFVKYENKEHGFMFLNDEARTMMDNYYDNNGSFDKSLYINGLDLDMFNQILDLYNKSL